MFRRDEEYGKVPTNVHRTSSFNLPVRKYRSGQYKGLWRIPSGSKARICDYGWVLNTHIQCVEYGVPFHFHQTGAQLRRSVPDGHGGYIKKVYDIPQEYQHTQAEKAGLDYGGGIEIPACLSANSPSICKESEEGEDN